MAQFSVYRNRNPASKGRFPLLLDVQSDLLEPLATRVVVPLSAASSSRARSMDSLTPTVRFDGRDYLMVTPQLAGIASRELGPIVGNLSESRHAIVAALDFLISGY
jgi:toxin CcdB